MSFIVFILKWIAFGILVLFLSYRGVRAYIQVRREERDDLEEPSKE